MNVYEINSKRVGEAWIKALHLIMRKGVLIHDENHSARELLNVFFSIEDAGVEDSIIKSFSDPAMLKFMKQNFLNQDPIPKFGYSYGQRLFNFAGTNQIETTINMLRDRPSRTSATITLQSPPNDLKHVPCVCTLDFKIRDSKLLLTAFVRSQDVAGKMPADSMALGTIQQKVADSLKIEKGHINVFVVSARIPVTQLKYVRRILSRISPTKQKGFSGYIYEGGK